MNIRSSLETGRVLLICKAKKKDRFSGNKRIRIIHLHNGINVTVQNIHSITDTHVNAKYEHTLTAANL